MAQQTDTLTVHFDFDKSAITPQAANVLDSLLRVHQLRKLQQIDLYGHCDFKGSDAYNDSLSEARIRSIKKYLTTKGIAPALFEQQTAFGERRPAASGQSDEARAVNRRVELVILWERATAGIAPTSADKPTISEMIRDTAVGKNLVLENMNFVGGRHILLPESIPILEDLLKALQENPGLKIEIQGYVCCTYGDEDGFDFDAGTNDLSVQRARAVYNFLVEKGIDSTRLRYQGFGGSRKLFPAEVNEYERSKNRRVEIKILSK